MQSFSKYLFISLIVYLLAFMICQLKIIILYLSIASVISIIAEPLVKIYSKFKIKNFTFSHGICSALALATLFAILIMFISMFIPLIVEEVRIISQINPNEVVSSFKEPLKNLEYDLQKYNISYGHGESIEKYLVNQLTAILGLSEVSAFAQGIFGLASTLIGATFAILFMSFFFIKDKHIIYDTIIMLTPIKHINNIKEILSDTKRLLTKYFLGVLADMAFVATLTFIGLSILGIKNALLIGVFAGLVNIIPYIGPIMGILFGLFIGVTTNLHLEFYNQLVPLMGKITVVFIIVQLIDALIFQPLVISNIVKAHPLEIFIVILIAGTFVGIGGMIIAVPVYTILRIIAKEFLNNFKFIQKLTEDLDEE